MDSHREKDRGDDLFGGKAEYRARWFALRRDLEVYIIYIIRRYTGTGLLATLSSSRRFIAPFSKAAFSSARVHTRTTSSTF
jgi:hypothetical protein